MGPRLLFDGDCGFCRVWIERWRAWTGDRVEYLTSQEAGGQYPEIPAIEYERSVQLIVPEGAGRRVYRGAEAVFRALAYAPGKAWPLRLYRRAPLVARVSEWAYALVARNRKVFSWATWLLWGERVEPSRFSRARSAFLRLLGLAYLAAFGSLIPQLRGLVGEGGILPARRLLEYLAAEMPGWERFVAAPTLAWVSAGDGMLVGMAWAGAALGGFALVSSRAGPGVFLALWALFLSLVNVCGEFTGFQWDSLLLESGLLAVALASRARATSLAGMWLLRALLFKLMFSSGAVKLASGDPTWRDLTALSYHYETQPLPHLGSWLAHQLPGFAQSLSTLAMFSVELFLPWLLFLPRRARHLGALGLFALQLLIAATGNYGYFNLLAGALCVLQLDDAFLASRLPKASRAEPEARALSRPRALALGAFVAMVATLDLLQLEGAVSDAPRSGLARAAIAAAEPFRAVNRYGLFAVMTRERREIELEASLDGADWRPYVFAFKPGDVNGRPRFAGLHMPRLDWQMWFAALTAPEQSPWVRALEYRLLQGSPEAQSLFESVPFEGRAPAYLRARLYRYRFAPRGAAGWWVREELGAYGPPLAREP